MAAAIRYVAAAGAKGINPRGIAQWAIPFRGNAARPTPTRESVMKGKSVSPEIRVRNPTFSVRYQMFSSHGYGVSIAEIKSTAAWVTSTMYSLAPLESNGG